MPEAAHRSFCYFLKAVVAANGGVQGGAWGGAQHPTHVKRNLAHLSTVTTPGEAFPLLATLQSVIRQGYPEVLAMEPRPTEQECLDAILAFEEKHIHPRSVIVAWMLATTDMVRVVVCELDVSLSNCIR